MVKIAVKVFFVLAIWVDCLAHHLGWAGGQYRIWVWGHAHEVLNDASAYDF